MAVVYETSARVKVYPCAYRGQVEESGVKYLYNPESRLPTENNITTNARVLATVGGGSYMLFPNNVTTAFDLAGSVALEFVIHGYRFEVNTQDIAASFAATTDVYAIIKLKDKNTGYSASNPHDYAATSLDNYNTSGASLDSTSFYGIGFDTAAPEGPFDSKLGPFYLHVLTRTATTDSFHIPSSSLLRLDSRNIANVSSGSATTDSISEHFITDQLEVVNGGDANIADELHVGGATTLGSTLSVTGDTTISGNLSLTGSMKSISVGSTTVTATSIQVADPAIGFGSVEANHVRCNTLTTKSGNDIEVNKHLVLGTSNKIKTNAIEATTSGNPVIISSIQAGNISTTGLTATGSADIGSSSAPFANIYGTTLHGTLNLTYTLKTPDADGEITGLTSGWYAVKMIHNSDDVSMFFPVYVPNNNDSSPYYSPTSDILTFHTESGSGETYNQIKLCGAATDSSTGKISFGAGVLTVVNSAVRCIYMKMKPSTTLSAYTIYVARISN